MIRSLWSKARSSETFDSIAGLVGIALLIVGVMLSAVALGAAPANAAPHAPAVKGGGHATVEVFWSMPDGGTPDRVTWPQTYSPDGPVECGVWYQVDTYKKKHVAALIEDSLLHQGEDYEVVISWRFVYGGDCAPEIPPAPEPYTEYGEWSTWTVDCEAGYAERGRWSWEVTWEWTGEQWVAVLGPDVADVERRDLTAEELAECAPATEEPTDPEPTPSEPEPSEPPTTDEPTEPVDPEPTTPVEPEPTTPVEPEPTTPVEPEPTTPVEPEPTTPVDPEPTTPVDPEPTTPVEPEPSKPPTASSRIYTPDVQVTAPDYLAETGPQQHAGAIVAAIVLLLAGGALTLVRKSRSEG